MEVTGSSLSLSSSYAKSLSSSMSESLTVWKEDSGSSSTSLSNRTNRRDELSLSDHAKSHCSRGDRVNGGQGHNDNRGMGFIKNLLQDALGVKIGVVDLDEVEYSSAYRHTDTQTGSLQIASATASDSASQTQMEAIAGSFEYSSTHYESQKMSLSLEGTVRTKDGQELGFKLDLNMSREFATQTDIAVQASEGTLSSPFTIDYDGLASDLGNQLFAFGLDNPVATDTTAAESQTQTAAQEATQDIAEPVTTEVSTAVAAESTPAATPDIVPESTPKATVTAAQEQPPETLRINLNSLHRLFKVGGNINQLFGIPQNQGQDTKNWFDFTA